MSGHAWDFSSLAQFLSMFIMVYVPSTYYLLRTQSEKKPNADVTPQTVLQDYTASRSEFKLSIQ